MTVKHQATGMHLRRMALAGAATATATVVTMAAVAPAPMTSPPPVLRPAVTQTVDLAASYDSLFPAPGVVHDITGGLANSIYNSGQNLVDALLPAIVNAINLGALGKATGLDLTGVIKQIPKALLPQILDSLPLALAPLLHDALPVLGLGDSLIALMKAIGVMDASGNVTLTKLLGLVGFKIDNLLNSGALSVPGVKIITAGPVFTLLKLLGIDLGWTPGTANAVAKAVENTPYLKIGAAGLIDTVLTAAGKVLPALNPAFVALKNLVNSSVLPKLDLMDIRVPLTMGLGFGAFSIGQSYDKIVKNLANQPDGVNKKGANLLGSLTIMPEVLLNNVGRANGGLLARFYPIGDLFGIKTVTPDVAAVHSGTGLDVLGTGLALGTANLLPVKVDATLEYQPFSDLAAWPNPFSLLNNLIAGTEPSYLLRGISTSTLTNQLGTAIGAIAGGIAAGKALAANIYLTIPTVTLPLLEPLYLVGDALNTVTFGTVGQFFTRLANALAPAISSLVNLGYTDVQRKSDGTYVRTLDEAGQVVPFFSFPKLNWSKVPGDIVRDLVAGFGKEFFSGKPTAATPNVIDAVVSLLTGGKLKLGFNPLAGPLALAGKIVSTLVKAVTGTPAASVSKAAAVAATGPAAVPAAKPKLVALSATPPAAVGDSGNKAAKADAPAVKAGKHAAPAADSPVPTDKKRDKKYAPSKAASSTDSSGGSVDATTSGSAKSTAKHAGGKDDSPKHRAAA